MTETQASEVLELLQGLYLVGRLLVFLGALRVGQGIMALYAKGRQG